MKWNLIILCFLLMGLYSCTEKGPEVNVHIQGSMSAIDGQVIYLEELEPLQSVVLDSAIVDQHGNFDFGLAIDAAGFYVLHTTKENSLVLLLEKNENVKVNTYKPNFGTDTELEGSPGSLLIQDFEKYIDFQRNRVDSLANVYQKARGAPDFFNIKSELDSIYLSYVEDQRSYIFHFIERHPASLVSLLVLNRKLGNTDVIDEKQDFKYLYRLDSSLQIHYPDNKHIEDHHQRVIKIKGEIFDDYVMEEKLQAGKRAPDIVLNDTMGQPLSLKQFADKNVIVYFWAGWDARSRRDNRRLLKLYPELQKRSIEILGVSLDEHEVVWKGAIKLDQLHWPQVSDLKGQYSPVIKTYHIPDELPFYYLIDKNQKIAYKHAHLDSLLSHELINF